MLRCSARKLSVVLYFQRRSELPKLGGVKLAPKSSGSKHPTHTCSTGPHWQTRRTRSWMFGRKRNQVCSASRRRLAHIARLLPDSSNMSPRAAKVRHLKERLAEGRCGARAPPGRPSTGCKPAASQHTRKRLSTTDFEAPSHRGFALCRELGIATMRAPRHFLVPMPAHKAKGRADDTRDVRHLPQQGRRIVWVRAPRSCKHKPSNTGRMRWTCVLRANLLGGPQARGVGEMGERRADGAP